jgi:acyl-CoA thioesterase FadM
LEKKDNKKTAAEGYIIYTMISIKTGKPVRIPEELVKYYTI